MKVKEGGQSMIFTKDQLVEIAKPFVSNIIYSTEKHEIYTRVNHIGNKIQASNRYCAALLMLPNEKRGKDPLTWDMTKSDECFPKTFTAQRTLKVTDFRKAVNDLVKIAGGAVEAEYFHLHFGYKKSGVLRLTRNWITEEAGKIGNNFIQILSNYKINLRYLWLVARAMHQLKMQEFTISINGPDKPVILSSKDKQYRFVVMPIYDQRPNS